MKKICKLVAVMLAIMIVFTACSSKNDASKDVKETEVTNKSEPAAKSDVSDKEGGEVSTNVSDKEGGEVSTNASDKEEDSVKLKETDKAEATVSEEAVMAPEASLFYEADEKAMADDTYGVMDYSYGSDFLPASGAAGDTGFAGKADFAEATAATGAADFAEATATTEAESVKPFDTLVPEEPLEPAEPFEPIEPYIPAAGILTAAEWNDNRHFDFLRNLILNSQQSNYLTYFTNWGFYPMDRLQVHVTSPDGDLPGARVFVYDEDDNVLWNSVTDKAGMAYLYYRLTAFDAKSPATLEVIGGIDDNAIAYRVAYQLTGEDLTEGNIVEVTVDRTFIPEKELDLMLVLDTTGSMGDEIAYLQAELGNVIERVQRQNANIPVRLSVNFYRDLEDGQTSYTLRSNPFSTDIDEQVELLRREYAMGGGDYEEAVELALSDAVFNHDWKDNNIKVMLLVLDAPPHCTGAISEKLAETLKEASRQGIRIIPVSSSGVDKGTEFLLRLFAMATGGTYTFLTDDSGVGESHIEPTVGEYEVELLNDLLVRIIGEYI